MRSRRPALARHVPETAWRLFQILVAACREGEEYHPKSSTSVPRRLQILLKQEAPLAIASGVGNATNALAVSVREDQTDSRFTGRPKSFCFISKTAQRTNASHNDGNG